MGDLHTNIFQEGVRHGVKHALGWIKEHNKTSRDLLRAVSCNDTGGVCYVPLPGHVMLPSGRIVEADIEWTNPPHFRKLADLSIADSALVAETAMIVADINVGMDERQAALDTLLEILDPRPITLLEWNLDTGEMTPLEPDDA